MKKVKVNDRTFTVDGIRFDLESIERKDGTVAIGFWKTIVDKTALENALRRNSIGKCTKKEIKEK